MSEMTLEGFIGHLPRTHRVRLELLDLRQQLKAQQAVMDAVEGMANSGEDFYDKADKVIKAYKEVTP